MTVSPEWCWNLRLRSWVDWVHEVQERLKSGWSNYSRTSHVRLRTHISEVCFASLEDGVFFVLRRGVLKLRLARTSLNGYLILNGPHPPHSTAETQASRPSSCWLQFPQGTIKMPNWGWRDGSAVESIDHSSREPGFNFQDPCGSSQL